jgi:hypothetical protein
MLNPPVRHTTAYFARKLLRFLDITQIWADDAFTE